MDSFGSAFMTKFSVKEGSFGFGWGSPAKKKKEIVTVRITPKNLYEKGKGIKQTFETTA